MVEYSDEELLEFTRQEATEKLTDEQMHRYNSLKAQQLQDDIEDYKGEKAQENAEGIGMIVEGLAEEMISTIEIGGNEVRVLVDPDVQEFKTISKLKKYSDLSDEEITGEKADEIKDNVLDLVGKFTVDYTPEEWKETFEQKGVGVRGCINLAEQIITVVEEEVDQKKRR